MSRNRDDLPIEKSERYRIAQSKNAIQLALDHVQREDAGHYTLFAKTKTGKVTRKDVELVVEDRSSGDDPPTFVRRLTDLSVKVGTRTRLLVEIRTSSQVKVSFSTTAFQRNFCSNFNEYFFLSLRFLFCFFINLRLRGFVMIEEFVKIVTFVL